MVYRKGLTDDGGMDVHISGAYKLNVAYKYMNQTNHQIEEWHWKHIWKTKVHISFFILSGFWQEKQFLLMTT